MLIEPSGEWLVDGGGERGVLGVLKGEVGSDFIGPPVHTVLGGVFPEDKPAASLPVPSHMLSASLSS